MVNLFEIYVTKSSGENRFSNGEGTVVSRPVLETSSEVQIGSVPIKRNHKPVRDRSRTRVTQRSSHPTTDNLWPRGVIHPSTLNRGIKRDDVRIYDRFSLLQPRVHLLKMLPAQGEKRRDLLRTIQLDVTKVNVHGSISEA